MEKHLSAASHTPSLYSLLRPGANIDIEGLSEGQIKGEQEETSRLEAAVRHGQHEAIRCLIHKGAVNFKGIQGTRHWRREQRASYRCVYR